ncbi:hypothetical protein [Marinibacterium sp. SX1]|uniref:hypothetical protein n=1 Tax=Marinibacterium sp. SX1 TaxID=3388424 RepID=UPI003D165BE1
MSYVGELRARLGLDAKPFDRGLRRSRGVAQVFSRQMRSMMAGVGVAIAGALSVRAVKSAMSAIDAQAKLAQSLGTTTESVQILGRASDLSGVSIGEMQQATLQMTKRLSQAARGGGPAAKALAEIGLSAGELIDLPLDERLARIQDAIASMVPEAQRASVATKIFGDRAGLVFTRIDSATLRQAAADVRDFGVAVSEQEADGIERTNDALSRLGLIATGIGNQIAAALAPGLEAVANGLASVVRDGNLVRGVIEAMGSAFQMFRGNLDLVGTALVAVSAAKAANFIAALGGIRGALVAVAAAARTTALAVWAAAGPWGILVGLVAGAAAYFLVFRDKSAEATSAMEDAKAAQDALNSAMGTFYESASPTAAKSAVELAKDYRDLAVAARDAARSNIAELQSALAKNQALQANSRRMSRTSSRPATEQNEQEIIADIAAAKEELAKAEAMLADAERKRKATATAVTSSMVVQNEVTKDLTDSIGVQIEGLENLGKAGGSVGDALKGLGEGVADLRNPAAEAEQSFRSLFTGIVSRSSSASEALQGLLGRMADLAANAAFDALFGKAGSGKSNSIFGAVAQAIIPGFANGTQSHAGGLAVVGERGRELVDLPKGSRVIPNHRTESMLSNSGSMGLRVYLDDSLSLQAAVESISGSVADVRIERATPAIVGSSVRAVSRGSAKTKKLLGV